ncbi:hypothetical protein TetV_194 [Tetraselmis virus 1]|uniref:Uncharacterized protein n=1 Tax=Tetraselmis virus 1 TaxID=2060617 RepID=A0A2P0VN09_9VIRU|nr:hypothetical protein QJ968_gp194 [Tetraselmis virus 1]AUF82286.1 hypothetical protein TetV_194 [Tetraselmis virus 1]
MFVIHHPHVIEDGSVIAAVTTTDLRSRYRQRISNLVVSDKDANWTRGLTSDNGEEWMQSLSDVHSNLSAVLQGWLSKHHDVLPWSPDTDLDLKPIVRKMKRGFSYIMFRNSKEQDLDYDINDECDFIIELREIRKSGTATGFTTIWRVVEYSNVSEKSAEEEREPAEEEHEPAEEEHEPAEEEHDQPVIEDDAVGVSETNEPEEPSEENPETSAVDVPDVSRPQEECIPDSVKEECTENEDVDKESDKHSDDDCEGNSESETEEEDIDHDIPEIDKHIEIQIQEDNQKEKLLEEMNMLKSRLDMLASKMDS